MRLACGDRRHVEWVDNPIEARHRGDRRGPIMGRAADHHREQIAIEAAVVVGHRRVGFVALVHIERRHRTMRLSAGTVMAMRARGFGRLARFAVRDRNVCPPQSADARRKERQQQEGEESSADGHGEADPTNGERPGQGETLRDRDVFAGKARRMRWAETNGSHGQPSPERTLWVSLGPIAPEVLSRPMSLDGADRHRRRSAAAGGVGSDALTSPAEVRCRMRQTLGSRGGTRRPERLRRSLAATLVRVPIAALPTEASTDPALAAAAMLGGATLVALAVVLVRHGGAWLLAIGMRLAPMAVGVRRVRLGGWPCLIAEARGPITAPPLVVLHGLGVRKETMLSLLAGLRSGRRVIAPDLPGFGEHAIEADLAARITRPSFEQGDKPTFAEAVARRIGPETDAYVEAIVAWIERVIDGHFDLAGASMGGALAASIAARMPERVERLVLLGPAGVRAPRRNGFMEEVEADRNPLEVRTVADLDRVIALNFVTPPRVPRPIRSALAADLRTRHAVQDLVIDALGPLLLDGLRATLPKISASTLVLWGGEDAILDASAAAAFAEGIPSATVEVVPDAGHTLHGDRPRTVIPRIETFLRR